MLSNLFGGDKAIKPFTELKNGTKYTTRDKKSIVTIVSTNFKDCDGLGVLRAKDNEDTLIKYDKYGRAMDDNSSMLDLMAEL